MSNMTGYNEYHGPVRWISHSRDPTPHADFDSRQPGSRNASPTKSSHPVSLTDASRSSPEKFVSQDDSYSEIETNPLQVGFWMEGDSLAPPCGCTVSTIHALLEFARVSTTDVVYDFGCGDGRVCLEAFARYHCRTVGIEIEAELVNRANELSDTCCVNLDDDEQSNRLLRPCFLHDDLRHIIKRLLTQTDQGRSGNSSSSDADGLLPLPSVIVLYLLPEAIALIQESLLALLSRVTNLRVVCNTWGVPGLRPVDTLQVRESTGGVTDLYLYAAASFSQSRLPSQVPSI
jgi:SAM-dependent methyltransferase